MDAAAALPPPPPVAPGWALFLDVDGTLLEFADRPDAVHVPPPLLETLAALERRLGGALALVSGRPLHQLDALFAPLRLAAVGLHGLELRLHAGDVVPAPDPPGRLAPLLLRARQAATRYPGALAEDKGVALALHWRGNPAAEPALRALAADMLPWLPGYRLQPGHQVLELRPDGADKGAAILALLADPPFHGRPPVFVGDDLTDEHGFRAVAGCGGLGVRVGGSGPTAAGHRLADVAAVRAWLAAGTGERGDG